MKKIMLYACVVSFLFVLHPVTSEAMSNASSQTTAPSFDQKKWDQLVKDAAIVIPGKDSPAGLSDKHITEMLKTYVWPKYANLGPEDPQNVNAKKLGIEVHAFTKDIWSGKYSTNGTFPKTGPEITTLDGTWKKDELTKKALELHNKGWWSARYPGEEKAVLYSINQYIKLSDDERKKRIAYHDLAGMMLNGQFSYDKYQNFAITGGYVKKFNTNKITIKYEGTADDGPLRFTVGQNDPSQKTYTIEPGGTLSLEAKTVPFVPPYGLAISFKATKNYPIALGVTTENTQSITIQRPNPQAAVKNMMNGKLAGNAVTQ